MLKQGNGFVGILVGVLVTGAGMVSYAGPADAQMNCRIQMEIGKVGFVVGFSGGSGTLTCNGQNYALEVGGVSAGLVICGSRVSLVGEVRNLHQVSDIEGTYTGVAASAAVPITWWRATRMASSWSCGGVRPGLKHRSTLAAPALS